MNSEKIEKFLETRSNLLSVSALTNPEEFLNKNSLETLEIKKQNLLNEVFQKEQNADNLRKQLNDLKNELDSLPKIDPDSLNKLEQLSNQKDILMKNIEYSDKLLHDNGMTRDEYQSLIEENIKIRQTLNSN